MQILIPHLVVTTTGLGLGTILGHVIQIRTVYRWVEIFNYNTPTLKGVKVNTSIHSIATQDYMLEYSSLLGNGT